MDRDFTRLSNPEIDNCLGLISTTHPFRTDLVTFAVSPTGDFRTGYLTRQNANLAFNGITPDEDRLVLIRQVAGIIDASFDPEFSNRIVVKVTGDPALRDAALSAVHTLIREHFIPRQRKQRVWPAWFPMWGTTSKQATRNIDTDASSAPQP